MRNMEKLLALLLALVLAAGMACTAAADADPHTNPIDVDEEGVKVYGDADYNPELSASRVLEGDMSVNSAETETGALLVEAEENDVVSFEVTGSVAISGMEGNDDVAAVAVRSMGVLGSDEPASAVLKVGGDVTAETQKTAYTLQTEALSGGSAELSVGGDIVAKGGEQAIAAGTKLILGSYELTVGGNVSAEGDQAEGIAVWSAAGYAGITVEGDVTAEGGDLAKGLFLQNVGGEFQVAVGGDVSAKSSETGIGIESLIGSASGYQAESEIIVEGTVSGSTVAIALDGDEQSKVTMTVWKVEPNKDGELIAVEGDDEDRTKAKAAEAALQYIIKVEAGQEGYVSTNAKKYEAFNGRTYEYALENETVTVKLNIPSGYNLDGVYGGSAVISVDGNGDYYLTVPRGGGVLISLKLSEKARPVSEEKEEKPKGPSGMILVSLTDKTGEVSMEFIDNGTFRIFSGDGSPADESLKQGRFWFDGKKINIGETYDREHGV